MKEPQIAKLTSEEKEEFIKHINECSLNKEDKQFWLELLNLYEDLREQLKSSNISIKKLREMLLGFKSDKVKKLFQIQ